MTTRTKVLELYRQVRQTHSEAFSQLEDLKALVRDNPELEEIADVVGVLKKSSELVDDLKKETNKLVSQFERAACMLYVKSSLLGDPIRTAWLTASPDAKSSPSLPTLKNDPEGYLALCKYFGIPEEAARNESFRPHWPGIKEIITSLEAEGKPLPPGIDPTKVFPEYRLTCRFRVDLDSLIQEDLK